MSEKTAACPNCGAEIAFRWSAAIQTTCPACRSILVRHDLDLEKVGEVADLPASTSGIQIGTEGRYRNRPFVVIGRIMYKYEAGRWNEWHLHFADGGEGWLSDAQAEYGVSFASTRPVEATKDYLGEVVKIGTKDYTLMSITTASYAGVEGELPFEYWDKSEVRFLDFRGDNDTFATIDESETPRLVFIGEFKPLAALELTNLRDVTSQADADAPKTRGLMCLNCGAAIVLRTGDLAQNVGCEACGSIIDATHPTFAILQKYEQKGSRVKPLIPLGQTGNLKGKPWQVIGFQVRGITVEGVDYLWREYLLWNRELGYRYLTEYDGHWNDVSVIKGLPRLVKPAPQPQVEYVGTLYKHFQGAKATTRYVIGEFPWQVRVGDEVWNDDYVAPPLMLSREKTESEITWSLGTYTNPEHIRNAFDIKRPLPPPKGIFANQPNPIGKAGTELLRIFVVMAALLFAIMVWRQMSALKQQVFTQGYRFNRTTEDSAALVTRVFELGGRTSNVELEIVTDLKNNWAYFNVALLAEGGGAGYEIGRELSRYEGYDSEGYWSEGSIADRAFIPRVPAGRYYLRIEPEQDMSGRPFTYWITVRRDVPRYWPFVIALLLLIAPPIIALTKESSFEYLRWAESDYATGGDNEEE